MQTLAPAQAYPITAVASASGVTITRAPTWTVKSRTRRGLDHTVTQVSDDGVLFCSCEAGMYGKTCWHREWVKDGRAGKPRIGIVAPMRPTPVPERPPRPAPRLEALPVDDLYSDGGAGVARSLQAVS